MDSSTIQSGLTYVNNVYPINSITALHRYWVLLEQESTLFPHQLHIASEVGGRHAPRVLWPTKWA